MNSGEGNKKINSTRLENERRSGGGARLDVFQDVRDAELLLTLSVHIVSITDLRMI